MKRIMLVSFAFLFTTALFAQSTQSSQMRDGFIMKKGKMIAIKNGQAKLVDKDIQLNNGSIITASGIMKTKDGKTVALKEGEYISVDGKTGMMKHGKVIEDKKTENSPGS